MKRLVPDEQGHASKTVRSCLAFPSLSFGLYLHTKYGNSHVSHSHSPSNHSTDSPPLVTISPYPRFHLCPFLHFHLPLCRPRPRRRTPCMFECPHFLDQLSVCLLLSSLCVRASRHVRTVGRTDGRTQRQARLVESRRSFSLEVSRCGDPALQCDCRQHRRGAERHLCRPGKTLVMGRLPRIRPATRGCARAEASRTSQGGGS